MLPLDLIIGFNNDEGLEAIVDLLMDPTNDTNFAQVLTNFIQGVFSLVTPLKVPSTNKLI